MSEFVLKRGLDLPITGAPDQKIHDGPSPTTVAVIGQDFIGLKPKMLIGEGDVVERGTPLFCHKDNPDVMYVAPAGGKVRAINRGARRVLQSVVIDVDDIRAAGKDFGKVENAESVTADIVREKLAASGLWTGFTTRPYSKVPQLDGSPAAILVTAMDTEPLAADAALIIGESLSAFRAGVAAISTLTEGVTFVCTAPGTEVDCAGLANVEIHSFDGPHPAGLAGTHLHFLAVPTSDKPVWTIGYQDVIAIGKLMLTGFLDVNRVISLAGPLAVNPRLLRTTVGASLTELTDGEIAGDEPCRVISGSVLTGRQAEGAFAYLGRYARQVTLIKEDTDQLTFGWILPQPNKFAVMPVLASAMSKSKLFNLTSNLNGGRRAMVPTGVFETLMPQDFLPTQLLRALLVMDTDTAQALGALELAEEDLALCTFACPAKYEYGEALRASLQKIEKEG